MLPYAEKIQLRYSMLDAQITNKVFTAAVKDCRNVRAVQTVSCNLIGGKLEITLTFNNDSGGASGT